MARGQKRLTFIPRRAALACLCAAVFSFAPAAAFAAPAQEPAAEEARPSSENFADDVASLERALGGTLSAAERGQANRLRAARLALESGDAQSALGELEKIPKDSLLRDYAVYHRSVALKKAGKSVEALKLLPEKIAFSRRLDWDILWHKLDLLALDKKLSLLKAAAEDAKKRGGKDKMVHVKAAYFLGKGRLLAGQKAEAFRDFQSVLVVNPGTEYDGRIFALLKKSGIPRSAVLSEALLNQRAERMIATGYAHQAVTIFEELARRDPATYRERVANAIFRARRYPEAARAYEDILKSGRHVAPKPQILTSLAQAYARQDAFAKAIETNQKIVREFPGTSAASIATGKLGFLAFDSGDYAKAYDFFAKNPARAGNKLRNNARWYRFWSQYLRNDFPKALEEAKALLAANGKGEGAQVFNYWIGRVYDLMGKKAEAKTHYQKVAGLAPEGYYGLLAGQRLRHGRLEPKFLIDDALLAHVPESGAPEEAPGAQSSETLKRAMMLHLAGLDTHAFDETQSYAKAAPRTRESVRTLQLAGNWYYGYSVKDSARAGRLAGCGLLCGWRTGFPRAYAQYVAPFASRWGLDERLAYSVMRQESVFKPEALSYAYAYGLMQIIPPTGEEIAGKIGYPGFHTGLLNQPRVNTLFGTYYLSYLMSEFGQEPVYAFAGYNAGPEAVSRWVKKYGNLERDVFIELIPYEQTHDYAKKVLLNYLTYRRLYR